jgi:hypothetical protein
MKCYKESNQFKQLQSLVFSTIDQTNLNNFTEEETSQISASINAFVNNNNGHGITFTPKGEVSNLFNTLIKGYSDGIAALIKMDTYSDDFINEYGNWIKTGEEPVIDPSLKYFNSRNGKIYINKMDIIKEQLNDINDNQIKTNLDKTVDIRNNSRNAEVFKKVINHTFPDVNVILLSDKEVIENNGFSVDGYIDDNGSLIINEDMFSPENGLHELGHIIPILIKQNNPKLYSNYVNEVKALIETNESDIVLNVKKRHKEAYSKTQDSRVILTEAKLIEEVLADIISKGTIAGYNTSVNNKSVISIINNLAKTIIKNFKDLLSGMGINIFGNTIEDLNKAITRAFEAGARIPFNNSQKNYLKSYFKETGAHYKIKNETKTINAPINNTKELLSKLVGINYKQINDIDRVRKYINIMKNNKAANSNKYEFIYNGYKYTFNVSLSKAELEDAVMKKIVIPETLMRNNLKNNIALKINNRNKKSKITTVLKDLLGKRTTESSINSLISYMNLDSKIVKIVQYSDLKNENNPILKQLYSESMDGIDPMVIIHNITDDGVVDLSIIDIAKNNDFFGDANIFERFMSDSEYQNKKEQLGLIPKDKMMNTDIDMRNLSIGLVLLDMQNKTNNKIKIRNTGTLAIGNKSTKAKLLHNPIGVIKNIAMLSTVDGFMETIKDEYLKKLINSAVNYNQEVKQDYVSQLKGYLAEMQEGNIKDPFDIINTYNDVDSFISDNIPVKEQLRIIGELKNFLKNKLHEEPYLNQLYLLLSRASRELYTGSPDLNNNLSDISSYGAAFTPLHNMKNDYVQDVVAAIQETTSIISTRVSIELRKLAGKTDKPGIARRVMRSRLKQNPNLLAKGLLVNTGSKIFEHLYKKTVLKVVNQDLEYTGEETEIFLPELHHTLSDPETKALYDKGILTDEDLEFTNKILEEFKTKWIDLIYQSKINNSAGFNYLNEEPYTKEQAEIEYDNNFNKGEIPVISKSSSEKLISGKIKNAIEQKFNAMSLSESLFDDMIDHNQISTRELSDLFSDQLSQDNRYKRLGIINKDGERVIINKDKIDINSTDVWKTFMYFNQSVIRKIEYENRVLPIIDNSLSILNNLNSHGHPEMQNIDAIVQIVNRVINRKNADDDKAFMVGRIEVKTSSSARALSTLYSIAVLPFKLSIGMMSFLYNTERVVVEGLSSSLTNSESGVPKIASFGKAVRYMFSSRDNFRKVKELALKHNIYNRTEHDLINSPWTDLTNFKIYQEAFLNIFNWGTDTFQRILTMTAVMVEDGTLEAWDYDSESGEIKYNEKKDRTYFDSNGQFISPETKAEYLRVQQEQIEEGLIKENESLHSGYSANWTTHVNWIVNKYIIGSFSDESKSLLGNKYFGHLMQQFRVFSGDRLYNLGIYGDTRKTIVGQKYKHKVLPDGTIISSKEVYEMESMFNSVQNSVKEIVKLKAFTPAKFNQWYSQQSDSRKYNLVKSMIQVIIFAMLYIASKAGDDDDEDEKQRNNRYSVNSKLLNDVFIIGSFVDMVNNPLPAISAINRMVTTDPYALVPMSGSVKEINRFISSNEEDEKDKE